VAVIGGLAVQQGSLRRQLADGVARESALRRDLAAAQEAAQRERQRADTVANAATPGGNIGANPNTSVVVAVTLAPGLLRDAPLPVVMVLPETLLVRADLVLPAANAVRYRARLLTEAGVERWSQDDLVPVERARDEVLRIDLPVTALPQGHVVLAVTGRSVDGTPVASEEFNFRVGAR
jgi:hypothetical protein